MPGPENPFANYRPPKGADVFSESGKLAIVQFKLERLAKRVEQSMLEDGEIERFVAGINFRTHYDFKSLEALASFQDHDMKLGFAVGGVAAGIESALTAKDISPESGDLNLHGRFYDRQLKVAIVSASFVETGA